MPVFWGGLVGAVTAVGVTLAFSGAAAAHPQHWLLAHRFAQPPTTSQCESSSGIACYNPSQFQQAYGANSAFRAGNTGQGRTIVIVDAFGSPTIRSDLQTFDRENGLSDPPSFEIITPAEPGRRLTSSART